SGDNLQITPLERSYKSKVLGHYPENVPWNPFDKNAVCMASRHNNNTIWYYICGVAGCYLPLAMSTVESTIIPVSGQQIVVQQLCLPQGLKFRTQKHPLEPQFHSFIITREDGSRNYGFSYIFFEEIRNKKICSAMQTLQAMHLTELSGCNTQRRSRQPGSTHEGHNTRSLPRHFKLSTPQQGAAQSYYDAAKDTLYVTKSIALVCQLPCVYAAHKFLKGLYRQGILHPSIGIVFGQECTIVLSLWGNVP
ncbi:unnamed protein product, partial [Timema podura]|nr:unnamed protein product [Timema podura]